MTPGRCRRVRTVRNLSSGAACSGNFIPCVSPPPARSGGNCTPLEELLQKSPDQPGSWQSLMADLADELPPSSFALLKDTLLAAHFVRTEDFALPLHYRLMRAKDSPRICRLSGRLRGAFPANLFSSAGFYRLGCLCGPRPLPDSTPEAGFQEPCSIFFPRYPSGRWHGFPKNSGPGLSPGGFRSSEIKKKPAASRHQGSRPSLSEEIRISSFYHLGESYNELSRQLIIL